MKKLLTLAVILSVCAVTASAAKIQIDSTEADKVSSALTEAKDKNDKPQTYPSTGASKKGVVTIKFDAELALDGYAQNLKSKKTCKAVVIDSEWLLASKHCTVTDQYVDHSSYMGAGSPPERGTYEVIGRYYKNFKVIVDGKEYAATPYYTSNQILLHADTFALSSKLAELPKANILVTSKDATLAEYKKFDIVVRRDSYVFGATETVDREIASLCTETSCIQVEYKRSHTDASAGDPMFVKLDNNQEFIVAFNSAQNYSGGSRDKRVGRDFKTITVAERAQIEKIIKEVTPELYDAIVKKIVNGIQTVEKQYIYK